MSSNTNHKGPSFILEIPVPGKKGGKRRLEFESEEDKKSWYKGYRKSKLFVPYFMVGIGINLLLYKLGLDLSRNLLLGLLVGVGIPILTMFSFTELHYRFFWERKL